MTGRQMFLLYIISILVAALLAGVVWAIRLLIWHDEVPKLVSKLRWVIAIFLAFLLMLVETQLDLNPSAITPINAFFAYVVAQALHAPKKTEDKKPIA